MAQCGKNNLDANATQSVNVRMSFREWKIQKEDQNNHTAFKKRPNKKKWNSSNSVTVNKIHGLPTLQNIRFDQNLYRNPPPPSFSPQAPTRFSNFNAQQYNNRQPPQSGRGYNRNGCNNNLDIDDNFFQTDDFYPQNDMLQEYFMDSQFCNYHRGKKPFNFRNSNTFSQSDRVKPKKYEKPITPPKNIENSMDMGSTPNIVHKLEPMVFVRNPNRKETKKPFIPMPKHPESEPNLTAEERKQQWRDYREAMKPFKNRDFYNAKRVVQRLGNKDPKELDEKQKFRLANAQERMAAYKQKLAEKYDNYVKSTDKTTENVGELYVLKKANTQDQLKPTNKSAQYKNYGNFGQTRSPTAVNNLNISSGRKILGGSLSYHAV